MAEPLFPVFDVPSELEDEEEQESEYLPAPMWDVETGDFVTDGAGKPFMGAAMMRGYYGVPKLS